MFWFVSAVTVADDSLSGMTQARSFVLKTSCGASSGNTPARMSLTNMQPALKGKNQAHEGHR